MSWFRVDDGFPESTKLESLESTPEDHALAVAAWTLLGADCMKKSRRTDGFVSDGRLTKVLPWPEGLRKRASDALVRCGLWKRVEGGFQYHDWADYQPSREEIDRDRKASTERQRRWREKQRARRMIEDSARVDALVTQRDNTNHVTRDVDARVTSTVTHPVDPPPSRPVPSSLTTFEKKESAPARASFSGSHVQEFQQVFAEEAFALGWKPAPKLTHTHLRQAAERALELAGVSGDYAEASRSLARTALLDARTTAKGVGFVLLECEPGRPRQASGAAPQTPPRQLSDAALKQLAKQTGKFV